MAKAKLDLASQCKTIMDDVRMGIFHPIYLLMGDEPYYPDLVCQTIIDHCVDEYSKDFNETICYGLDVTPEKIVFQAREFPMMAERRLIVIRDAQLMDGLEQLDVYCKQPIDSTVLVILMRKASLDKRKALYKTLKDKAIIVDSPMLRDYEMPSWIKSYVRSLSLNIEEPAVALLSEYVGTELSNVSNEILKITKNLPSGSNTITVNDVERNVGLSRRFSVFELNKCLSTRDAVGALKIAANMGSVARFAMPQAVSALFLHFSRIFKYGVLLSSVRQPSAEDKARVLAGISPYFYREYDTAVRHYPSDKAEKIISLLCEYDYLGKGGDGGNAQQGELLLELVTKILNI